MINLPSQGISMRMVSLTVLQDKTGQISRENSTQLQIRQKEATDRRAFIYEVSEVIPAKNKIRSLRGSKTQARLCNLCIFNMLA